MSPEQRPYKDVIQLYLYCNKEREVPEAIIAFLESKDFEDAVRNAVSLGGDTDTLGAITGSIAEAFYGIPAVLIAECKSRIDKGRMFLMNLIMYLAAGAWILIQMKWMRHRQIR